MILTYNGSKIQQREEDNFVNLTQMAKANNVLLADWVRLQSTKDYLTSLESVVGIPISQLLIVKKGNSKDFIQGTWAHPLVALNFGRWINPKFAIWCDMHIKTLLETGKTEIIKPVKLPVHYYSDRIMLLDKNLNKPKNTWCVIEKCAHLLLKVEKLGYEINPFDLMDGSIGKQYSHYRKDKSWCGKIQTAKYILEDQRGKRDINAFENKELGYFADWLDNIYEPFKLPIYLKKKYKALVKI